MIARRIHPIAVLAATIVVAGALAVPAGALPPPGSIYEISIWIGNGAPIIATPPEWDCTSSWTSVTDGNAVTVTDVTVGCVIPGASGPGIPGSRVVTPPTPACSQARVDATAWAKGNASSKAKGDAGCSSVSPTTAQAPPTVSASCAASWDAFTQKQDGSDSCSDMKATLGAFPTCKVTATNQTLTGFPGSAGSSATCTLLF